MVGYAELCRWTEKLPPFQRGINLFIELRAAYADWTPRGSIQEGVQLRIVVAKYISDHVRIDLLYSALDYTSRARALGDCCREFDFRVLSVSCRERDSEKVAGCR